MATETIKENGKFRHYTKDGFDVIKLGNVAMFFDTSVPVTHKLRKVECSTSMFITKPDYKVMVSIDPEGKRVVIGIADKDGYLMWVGHGVFNNISEAEEFQHTYYELAL